MAFVSLCLLAVSCSSSEQVTGPADVDAEPGGESAGIADVGSGEQDPADGGVDESDPTAQEVEPAAGSQAGEELVPAPAVVDDPDRYERVGDRFVAFGLAVVVFTSDVERVDVAAAELADLFGGAVVGVDEGLRFAQIEFVDDPDPMLVDLLEQISARPEVAAAELSTASIRPAGDVPSDWLADFWDDKDPRWHIEVSGVDELWSQGYRAAPDVGVLIADWAILDDHPDLEFAEPVISRFGDTPIDRIVEDQSNSHGSKVAGIACGLANGGGIVGVAQGCQLYGIDFLAAGYDAYSIPVEAVIKLLDETVTARPQIRIVNMSFGYGPDSTSCTKPAGAVTVTLFRQLFQKHPDVLWVAAAGNCSIEIPLLDETALSNADALVVPFPAGAASVEPNVVAVGSVNEDQTLAELSNFGPGVSVTAPGGRSLAGEGVWAASQSCDGSSCETGWQDVSGTSMAAPFYAGLVALAWQAAPNLEIADITACTTSSTLSIISAPEAVDCAIRSEPLVVGLNQRPLDSYIYTTFQRPPIGEGGDSRGSCFVGLGWAIPRVPQAVFYAATIKGRTGGEAVPVPHQEYFYDNRVFHRDERLGDSSGPDVVYDFDPPLIDIGTGDPIPIEDEGLVEGRWLRNSLIRGCTDQSGAAVTEDTVSQAISEIFLSFPEQPTIEKASYYIWQPPEVPANNAAIEYDFRQVGDRCEWIEWWSMPANSTTTTVLLFNNQHDGFVKELRPDTLNGELPSGPRAAAYPIGGGIEIDTTRFEPYNTPGRVASGESSAYGPDGMTCDQIHFFLSQQQHIELADQPMQPHCQLLTDPTQRVDYDIVDWPNSEATCYWSEPDNQPD